MGDDNKQDELEVGVSAPVGISVTVKSKGWGNLIARFLGVFVPGPSVADQVNAAIMVSLSDKLKDGRTDFTRPEQLLLMAGLEPQLKKAERRFEIAKKALEFMDPEVPAKLLSGTPPAGSVIEPPVSAPPLESTIEPPAILDVEDPRRESATPGTGPADDWLDRFRADAELVSDELVQELYARILAGEFTTPGSYSVRTLNVLRGMDRELAEKFSLIAPIVFGSNSLLSWNTSQSIYDAVGTAYGDLLDLADAGLINLMNSEFSRGPDGLIYLPWGPFVFRTRLAVEVHALTRAGRELVRVCDPKGTKTHFLAMGEALLRRGAPVEVAVRLEQIRGGTLRPVRELIYTSITMSEQGTVDENAWRTVREPSVD